MLVLSRRANESIVLGDNITVTVLGVEGGVVRLGISAPPAVSVVRGEILQQVGQENRRAAAGHGLQPRVLASLRRAAAKDCQKEEESEGKRGQE